MSARSSRGFLISQQPMFRKLLSAVMISILTLFVIVAPLSVQAAKKSSTVSNSVGNMINGSTSCKYGDYIYYSIYGEIYRINVKTLKKETVFQSTCAFTFASMNISEGWIYCTMNTFMGTGGSSCYIYKVRTNGKDGQILAEGESPTTFNGWIYYIAQKNVIDPDNTTTLGIYKMKLNGEDKTCIKKSSEVLNCVSDGKKLYYSTWGNSTKWYQMCLNGTDIQKIGKTDMLLSDIEDGYIYYTTYNYDTQSGKLYKQKIGSKKSTQILSTSFEICNANIENGWIYYSLSNQDYTKNTMYKVKTNGSNKKKLIMQDGLESIMLHGDYIYYIITINGKNNTILKKYYES